MKKLIKWKVLLFFVLLISAKNQAQNITGSIVDQNKNPLEFVAIAMMSPIDSTLIGYANTDEFGKFKLIKIPKGEGIFQVH